jgi:thiol-disulfide isomerase/thioredoxin
VFGSIVQSRRSAGAAPRGGHAHRRTCAGRSSAAKVVLLFFWAHWCADCKAESATVEALLEKYRERGLVLIAPTQRYGFAAEGRPAAPDRELRYIMQVRDTYYRFMREEASSTPPFGTCCRRSGVASSGRRECATEPHERRSAGEKPDRYHFRYTPQAPAITTALSARREAGA